MPTNVFGLVPAAGNGRRFTPGAVKQLLPVAGRPTLAWSLDRLLALDRDFRTVEVIVALPASALEETSETMPEQLAAGTESARRIRWVVGGESRQESVECCLRECRARSSELVMVHDAARPALSAADLLAVLKRAAECGAAVLGRPVGDTLKRCREGWIEGTMDRSELFRAETPQVFRRELLDWALTEAHHAAVVATDEAGLVENMGAKVAAVIARDPNPKITWPGDEIWAAALLGADPADEEVG